jgi:AcrR family transcriptional regulator
VGPNHSTKVSDHKSETVPARIGRPPVPPARILAAADALLADTDAPNTVTMDDIATAAGVGKGTLFRAFGSRDSLLDTLWATKLTALREAVEGGKSPLGPGAPSRQRAVAFLDALLTFKLENRHLIRMRERDPAGIRQAKNYKWSHGILQSLIEDAAPAATAGDAGYAAHVLLAALDINLIDELLATGRSLKDIRHAQAALAQAVIDDSPHR